MLSRRWATYNEPLVEVVHQAQVAAGRPATVIDVGAAIGDTVLLLRERLGAEVGEVWCIEGDAEFFPLLERNLAGLGSVHFVRAMLSDGGEWEPSLVRIHLGTASAQGFGRVGATTLDRVLAGVPGPIDVIKVDTDGLDGKVLAGAASVLDGARPAVIFEWHPGLYKATGNDWRRPFHVLAHCGYDRFAWFTKFGEFSHVDHAVDDRDVTSLAQLCLRGDGPTSDWHYDVVALHGDSPIDVNEVAALRTARATRRGWHRRHVSLAAGGSE
jgi:FkbM family methyltransferase